MIDTARVHEYLRQVDPNSEEYFLPLELLAHERAKNNEFQMPMTDHEYEQL